MKEHVIFIFLATALSFVGLMWGVHRLIRRSLVRRSTAQPIPTASTYECGEEALPIDAKPMRIPYYGVALLFLVLEVEVLFLFPLASTWQQAAVFPWVAPILLTTFIAFLGLGVWYAIARLDTFLPLVKHVVAPLSAEHEALNAKYAPLKAPATTSSNIDGNA